MPLNPAHQDAKRIVIVQAGEHAIDPRLLSQKGEKDRHDREAYPRSGLNLNGSNKNGPFSRDMFLVGSTHSSLIKS